MKKDDFRFCWVVDFPLFEFNEDSNSWQARHHIFTSPMNEDVEYLEKILIEFVLKLMMLFLTELN